MHSPATTPDEIKATPARIGMPRSNRRATLSHRFETLANRITALATRSPITSAVNSAPLVNSEPISPPRAAKAAPHAAPAVTANSAPINTPLAGKSAPTTDPAPDDPASAAGRWRHYATINRERGMSTAEYAVGTIAACAFAALLFKVVSSPEVQELLTSLIDKALNTSTGG
ncbi:DUF4244 domain-containing protein [Nonomuraea sp. NPDC002799]